MEWVGFCCITIWWIISMYYTWKYCLEMASSSMKSGADSVIHTAVKGWIKYHRSLLEASGLQVCDEWTWESNCQVPSKSPRWGCWHPPLLSPPLKGWLRPSLKCIRRLGLPPILDLSLQHFGWVDTSTATDDHWLRQGPGLKMHWRNMCALPTCVF